MTSKEFIQSCIVKLEDDLQHYTMVDKDNVKAKYIELELEDYRKVLQDLERLEIERQAYKNLKELYDIDTKSLLQQNEKLKKAIEILKDKLSIVLTHYYEEDYHEIDITHIDYVLTQEEYELLKEVLE